MINLLPIHTILVPQGAEYKAVCRGLSQINSSTPTVVAIPIGMKPLTKYLEQLQTDKYFQNDLQPRVIIMGICGSLSKRYAVGDIVLYQNCVYQKQVRECDRIFTTQLHSRLSDKVSLVNSLSCDRVIWSATEKLHLGETLGTDVVDMEGFAALEFFNASGVAVAMLRVVSDDSGHDIPDLTPAINPNGSLQPLALAMALLRQPIAATRLIRGSLTGLKMLEQVTNLLFSGYQLE
ncbi:phosphorylase [Komarekiella sp. 'clone 1']|uniref:Phosphorylase n=1 Tax=Komarekiella delphini-convector SJRDD-AB1 TaxID=2593771 RepID=A0AA40VR27_9NOST|nr:phosphorylase [Komarekiella delphini-convector]MBD6616754.1 phosphorylase [Komarekiella delphini-convector SJRDD-AB1]